jgi:CBS domain-containing protein
MVMLAEFLRFRLVDRHGRRGRPLDVAIDVSAGDYPPVTRLIYHGLGRLPAELPWSDVSVDWPHRRLTVPDLTVGRAAPAAALTRSVLARRDVLDALVVDVASRQTARANDLWFREIESRFELAGADVSPWAVLRRLARGLLGRGTARRLLDWKDLEFLRGDPRAAREGLDYHRQITRLQPSEIASLLDALPYLHAAELLALIPDTVAADTFEVMSEQRQHQVFQTFEEDERVQLLGLIAPDDAADVLGRVPPDEVERLLAQLDPAPRDRVVNLLRFPFDTAGGIMTNHVPIVPAALTVAQVRRELAEELREPDFVYYLYAVDSLEGGHLEGVVTLREFALAEEDTPMRELMNPRLTALDPLQPASDAAREVAGRDVLALPVVGQEGELLGAVTLDAALAQLAPAAWAEQAPRVFS